MSPSSSFRSVGAHLSVAGGYRNAIDRALAINANALQIFSGSPRSWQRPSLDKITNQRFRDEAKDRGIRDVFVHALYLINLTSDTKEIVQKSVDTLIFELQMAQSIRSEGVVVHLGSHQGKGFEAVKSELALLIKHILQEADSSAPFLMENSAGQKGKLCSDFAEIRWLMDEVGDSRLGWCYDTCHGWAAGHTAEQFAAELKKYDLADSLRCFHVNDSRDPFDSGRDRHDNIGEGSIPAAEMRAILTSPQLNDIPIITEAPGFDGTGPDAENIRRIREIIA